VDKTFTVFTGRQPVRCFYSSRREKRSKFKHPLVDISVQRVQLTNIVLLNSKGSHHL
jgi:hypothetical protein